jgi:pyrroline-5-carboxylate reductase
VSGLWLIGAGNMGRAILDGWLASGTEPSSITVVDPGVSSVPPGVRLSADPPVGERPNILVLAVKPQMLDAITQELQAARPRLLVSILAGVEVAALGARFEAGTIIRAMPNLPVAVRKGVTALFGTEDMSLRGEAASLFEPLGKIEWIDAEASFDAVTALSGCGPGFVFRFVDALAEAGECLGLPVDQARRLAIATVEGSARMAAISSETPATLADQVASPGGSTREGLNVLDDNGALKALLLRTLEASARRNREMATAARISA